MDQAMDSLLKAISLQFRSVQFSHSVVFDSLQPHGHEACQPSLSTTDSWSLNSCPSGQWCHPTISSSIIPFFSGLQSFPASGFFPTSQFFTSGGQSIGVSALASVLPMNIQNWFPSGLTGWISLQSRTVVLEKTLASPLNCKKIKTVNPKGNQSWMLTGRTDAEAEAPRLWPSDGKNWLIGKNSDAGRDWRQDSPKICSVSWQL